MAPIPVTPSEKYLSSQPLSSLPTAPLFPHLLPFATCYPVSHARVALPHLCSSLGGSCRRWEVDCGRSHPCRSGPSVRPGPRGTGRPPRALPLLRLRHRLRPRPPTGPGLTDNTGTSVSNDIEQNIASCNILSKKDTKQGMSFKPTDGRKGYPIFLTMFN